MNYIKNYISGFLISFVGSLPLGQLNLIGLNYYSDTNYYPLIWYLLGVVIVEGFVIYLSVHFMAKLKLSFKTKAIIGFVTVALLATLTYLTYNIDLSSSSKEIEILSYNPFLTGIIVSSINVAQIPFWFSWSLNAINLNYIKTGLKLNIVYTLGGLIGTFLGMLLFILTFIKLSENLNFNALEYVWLIFLGLTIFQLMSTIRILKRKSNESS